MPRLVERIFGNNQLIRAVFLDVAKTFDIVWVDGLVYKFTVPSCSSYVAQPISSYLEGRMFQAATTSRLEMRAGVAQGRLISPVLFSLYVNNMPVPSPHVELALYADVTSITATSRKPALLVSYLKSYLKRLRFLAVKTKHRHQRLE